MFLEAYRLLLTELGPSGWWPAKTPFEVIVGAILTQNTSWKNVELALGELRKNKLLSPRRIGELPRAELARLIKSSGYYNQKARKLQEFLEWFAGHGSSIARLKKRYENRGDELREELLGLFGIGPETADSILCYALDMPYFVVDAYTFRWLERYRPDRATNQYEILRDRVEREFRLKLSPAELTPALNEFHALLVRLCSGTCRKREPACASCPLRTRCVLGNRCVLGKKTRS